MGNLFKKSKKPISSISDADRAVLDLKIQRDKMYQNQEKLKSLADKDLETARKFLAENNKNRALLCLKQKKFHIQLIEDSDHHIAKVTEIIANVEYAQMQEQMVTVLERGNVALKVLQEACSLEYVEKLVEESEEAERIQQEINQMLFNRGITNEDEDVMKDLDKMLRNMNEELLDSAPRVPTEEPGKRRTETQRTPQEEQTQANKPQSQKSPSKQRQAIPA
eukprot:Platyproteum_vivax@DN12637_c0_g1_i1.p1